jgi:formamidopyrimidine-DNA glycosylase
MPELPEVETLCRQLQKKITGGKVSVSEVYDAKLAHVVDLRKRSIMAVRRNGKTVEIILSNGHSALIHLRMTGRLLWQEKPDRPKHSRWHISLSGGELYLVDPRRFATINILPTNDLPLGKDILQDFDKRTFLANHARRKVAVKNLLMDQNAVAGIGNIYACEVLHRAGIHPERIAADVAKKEWLAIFRNAGRVLRKAIEKRGTSISDWRDLYGRPGENQNELQAYGREGQRCFKCGSTISRIKQGGRSTFYCPGCQK